MQRLFHFSDFHISLNSGMPAENRNFQALLTELGEFKCSDASNYIAFSGDVIDNGYISKQADPNKARKECYELAIDYFRELRDALNVPKENLVFCCGNHDVIRGEYTGAHALCDPAVNYSTVLFSDGYSAFSEFHKKATGRSYSYKAHTYEVGDFLFLSANSTWISKQKDGYIKDEEHRDQMQPQRSRCVDCKGLCAELSRNAVTLASKTACGKSILLVHDPLTSWCENALIDYEGSKPVETRGSEEVYRSLQSLFSYCLCGDKHATAQVADCYIVKTKLDSDIVGIMREHERMGKPLTFEQIDTAVKNLYDGWENMPENAYALIQSILSESDMDELYETYVQEESAAKDVLISFDEKYPKVVQNGNLDAILSQLLQRQDKEKPDSST